MLKKSKKVILVLVVAVLLVVACTVPSFAVDYHKNVYWGTDLFGYDLYFIHDNTIMSLGTNTGNGNLGFDFTHNVYSYFLPIKSSTKLSAGDRYRFFVNNNGNGGWSGAYLEKVYFSFTIKHFDGKVEYRYIDCPVTHSSSGSFYSLMGVLFEFTAPDECTVEDIRLFFNFADGYNMIGQSMSYNKGQFVIDYGDYNNSAAYEEDKSKTAGNDSTSDVNNAVPDKSAGFLTAIKKLIGAMSYDGTTAVWKVPEIKLPALQNVMEERTLLDETSVDFGAMVAKFPNTIISLVQNLLTAGLIVFCFKELYDTIQYVLTLRGGGKE